MTSFSNLLSSIGNQAQAPQTASSTTSATQLGRKSNDATSRFRLTANNAAAGVKRKPEELDSPSKAKSFKTETVGQVDRANGLSSRFQLSAKSKPGERAPLPPRKVPVASASTAQKAILTQASKPGQTTNTPTPPPSSDAVSKKKGGFASILERAKAAQEASKAANAGGIKHKPVEKLSRKDRMRMMEEHKAQQRTAKRPQPPGNDRSRSLTPVGGKMTLDKKVPQNPNYRSTMKKAEPLNYKGTMRAVGATDPGASSKAKKKGQAQDKYGGYASWSDLDDAEDDDEPEDYESEGSDDMDAGFDDMEAEEMAALRLAKREDQEAMEEEERLRREKLLRKRKLEQLSKEAALKKKY